MSPELKLTHQTEPVTTNAEGEILPLFVRASPSDVGRVVSYAVQLNQHFKAQSDVYIAASATGDKVTVRRERDKSGRVHGFCFDGTGKEGDEPRAFRLQELSPQEIDVFCLTVAGLKGIAAPPEVYRAAGVMRPKGSFTLQTAAGGKQYEKH